MFFESDTVKSDCPVKIYLIQTVWLPLTYYTVVLLFVL